MKKVFFSLLAIAATMNVMATTYTSKAKLTLTTAGGDVCYITVASSTEKDIHTEMNMDNRDIAIYVIKDAKPYQTFCEAALEEVALGLKTNAETSYTLTATEVVGTMTIKLLDGTIFEVAEGASTTFAAEANQTEITGMVINPHAVPTEFKVCHQYGKIIVDNPTTEPMDVVLDGEKIGEAAAQTFASEVTVTAAAGQHTLEINGQTLIISVQ